MAANEHQQKEEESEGPEPAHHARRPMNAFLIFCKRHRASVRSGFPHLENRAVTRVLGEWWAMLIDEQKQAYTNLAQEYKDAFLNANPDFKWYKLPAPPLRTLNTRPTNKKGDLLQLETETNKNQLQEDFIQPGKLADESQIGGLSSLFTPQKNCPSSSIGAADEETDNNLECPKPPKKRFADPLVSFSLKEDCKADLFGNHNGPESNNNSTNISQVKEETITDNEPVNEEICEDESNGTVYQKFSAEVASQQIKQRPILDPTNIEQHNHERRNSISSNISEKTDSLCSEGTNSRGDLEYLVQGAEGKLEASKPENTVTGGADSHSSWMSRKRFKAEDFNLEKKIEALPSLSLEEFQAMKKQQRTKKKKTTQRHSSSTKKRSDEASLSYGRVADLKSNTQREAEKALVVGSQKRKARKQNITRNTMFNKPPINNQIQSTNKTWCESPDLEALACLATVAANRTKLTKS
ncbi:transcription factor Sox-11 isoform X1 [Trichogramma pretiosum]|uniref:transcription factor Sox-11 isoform X1 n=2 Tax=Trichogramma pretiosum TaxID=7493 RepID=UPI0006C99136|nr:transcription factor Sox-11 isoform X1 [Trichogramma pretiosum]